MRRHANSTDVARRAGVSQTTVSLVINDRRNISISPETRQRVLDAAEALQYRSNRLSHGIFKGRTGLIGVVLPQIADHYYSNLLLGISREGLLSGAQPLVAYSPKPGEDGPEPLKSLIEYRVDGVVWISDGRGIASREVWLRELLQKDIPCVVIDDRYHSGLIDCIVNDDISSSRAAVEDLIAAGHENIAHLAAGSLSTTAVDRLNGYLLAMRNAGLEVRQDHVAGESYSISDGAAAAKILIHGLHRPTAIFAANDGLASEAMKEIRRAGLACPEDIAVIGYGNTGLARALDMTSVEQNPEQMGRLAVQTLLNRGLNPSAPPSLTQIECSLVRRGSTEPRSDFSQVR